MTDALLRKCDLINVKPNKLIATATASSKKLLAPISAPGDATLCGTFAARISR